jgi:AIPR protein
MKVDSYFEIFASQQALKMRRFNPDPVEIESGIVGGGDDGGVDGFYLFVNRKFIREDTDPAIFKDQQLNFELVIVQAKNKSSFEESVPQKLKDFTEHCLPLNADIGPAQKLLYSESLLAAVKQFHDIYQPALLMHPKLAITFCHVSLGEQVDAKVQARADLLLDRLRGFFPTVECDYQFIRGNRLLKLFQQQPERTLSLATPKYFDWKAFDRGGYVCVVKLPDFHDFIAEKGELREYLFEANVRDHAPDVKVNKGISATLANPANEEFWWLNNGITLLASGVFYNDGALQITDPLIVNGLQTSYEIFNHFTSGASKSDERTLLVRVIANTVPETSDHIINATNSQTKIEPINLHATEQIHRNIEAALKMVDLYYDRRKNFYRNKGISTRKIVTIGFMAQAVTAIVLQQPDNARARPTTVAEKNYSALFSEDYPPAMYQKCAQIIKRTDSFLEEQDAKQSLKLNLLFYVGMYATCSALKSAKPNRTRIAGMDVSLVTDAVLNACHAWILSEFLALGGNDKVAKGPELTEKLRQRIRDQYGRKKKPKP